MAFSASLRNRSYLFILLIALLWSCEAYTYSSSCSLSAVENGKFGLQMNGRRGRRCPPFYLIASIRQSLHLSAVSPVSPISVQQLSDLQSQTEQDTNANLMVQALQGRNINNDDRAAEGARVQLVNMIEGSKSSSTSSFDALRTVYDPVALKNFFKRRPEVVITRIIQIMSVGGGFFFRVLLDNIFAQLNRNNKQAKMDPELEVQRAGELRDIITTLGPFFIKLGQALSIRPDVLSPRSMVELQKLCDKVPSFDSTIAFATIEKELKRSIDDLFTMITPEPVAAASLGQVYTATLRDTGEEVAVKVQRPGVLETVSLDLYLARELGLLARHLPGLTSTVDAVALLDEFAYRFYHELDYELECVNGIRIRQQMKVLPMVVVPRNYPQYTSRRVHVAEWIAGEKLSQSTADDVGALVNLGVITYLTQLLEFGFFHADPHPGNMMRTNDGRLAILDFGLMTEVTDDQKYGMIEAIVHLLNRDYSEIGQDFINLDFIPRGTDTKPIVPALTKVFDVALAGGGAKSINFQELAADLAQITFDYPFRIPPYFALVIRAISVLEGIALVGNPNFAIIDEAYPYIARRLMTDNSPRLKAALRYMVYGNSGVFDAARLIDLLQALEKFKAVRDEGDGTAYKIDGVRGAKYVGKAGDVRGSQVVNVSERDTYIGEEWFANSTSTRVNDRALSQGLDQTRRDETTVRDSLRFFFSPEGHVLREFMLEELVTVVDASNREASRDFVRSLGLNNYPLPSLFTTFIPKLTGEDKMVVKQVRRLVQFLLGEYDGSIASDNDAALSNKGNQFHRSRQEFALRRGSERFRKLIPMLREYAPQLREYGGLLLVRLSEKSIARGLSWASDRVVLSVQ